MTSIKKPGFCLILLAIIISLAACQKATLTVDAAQKITEVYKTIQADITQKAALTPSITPTFTATITPTEIPATPTLSETELSTSATPTVKPTSADAKEDKAAWVADVTNKDGTIIKPNTTFVRTWAIKNTGKTTWGTAYRLVYLDGLQDSAGALYVHLPQSVKPNEVVNVSVTFTTPSTLGTYYSYWRLVNADGQPFGEQMSMKIYAGNP
jgi:hypothetical protein